MVWISLFSTNHPILVPTGDQFWPTSMQEKIWNSKQDSLIAVVDFKFGHLQYLYFAHIFFDMCLDVWTDIYIYTYVYI